MSLSESIPILPVDQELLLTPSSYVDALIGAVGLENPLRLVEDVAGSRYLRAREKLIAFDLIGGLVDLGDSKVVERQKILNKATRAGKELVDYETRREEGQHQEPSPVDASSLPLIGTAQLRRLQILRQRRTKDTSRRIGLHLREAALPIPKEIPQQPEPPRYGR